jgi:hypothetical protein
MSNQLPDDNPAINQKNYLLDPLSVIVKLAILANKPVGTKVCIQNNVMTFQDPGLFQGFCRTMYNLNKTDLHYMYNPIQLACSHFLSAPAALTSEDKSSAVNYRVPLIRSDASGSAFFVKSRPRMRNLFAYAQKGLERLMETYRTNSTIRHSLNYYHAIIANYVDAKYNPHLFRKDGMSVLYGDELIVSLNGQWTDKWIKAVLDMNGFLSDESISSENIRVLESLMMTIDEQTKTLFMNGELTASSVAPASEPRRMSDEG